MTAAVWSTATRPRDFRSVIPDVFPPHFSDTSCVFLTDAGHCGLQLLSGQQGRHPWHFKPFGCWLHPIVLAGNAERGRRVVLPDEEFTDPGEPSGTPNFVCSTRCGATDPAGAPAHEVLDEELRCLGATVGRDFLGEIRGVVEGEPVLAEETHGGPGS